MNAILIALIFIPTLIVASLFGGTVLWLAWEPTMLAFPALVNGGYVVPEISWLSAVCLSFVFGVLVKSTQTTHK